MIALGAYVFSGPSTSGNNRHWWNPATYFSCKPADQADKARQAAEIAAANAKADADALHAAHIEVTKTGRRPRRRARLPPGRCRPPDQCHLLSTADNWGGPMRSLIFWWFLSMYGRDWWTRFLDRYGPPFVVGKYDQGDDTSRTILKRAFSYAMKVGGLVVSKETEVDIKQAAATDSGEAYKSFIEWCNREKSKLILGETLSSDAQAGGGMNNGNAELQGDKRSDKRQSDARRLGATLRTQLFEQYLAIIRLHGSGAAGDLGLGFGE